jgi:prevent-host-death family protein
MTSISITEARETLADLINNVYYRNEVFILTKRNKTIAAVISPEQYRLFLSLLRHFEDEVDHRDAQEALAEARELGTIKHEDLKKELGL